jgi:hypothetical protein
LGEDEEEVQATQEGEKKTIPDTTKDLHNASSVQENIAPGSAHLP